MPKVKRKYLIAAAAALVTASIALSVRSYIPFRDAANKWLYDKMVTAEYHLSKEPPAINDIVLVLIDNDTLNNMPSRWPYPRSNFAKVIDNLENAGAKVIAFDFAFLGRSDTADDATLKSALEKYKNIILACSVNERGAIEFRSFPEEEASKETKFGIVTKLQDKDGVTRRALTYLVSEKDPAKGFLSWELQILKSAEKISLNPFSGEKDRVILSNGFGESWAIPVRPDTKSFLINFKSHTKDFKHISFYDAFEGRFDPSVIKGRIVMVGLASLVFADLHNTPIGWMPGVTINVNAFLTLYNRDFLNNVPAPLEIFIIIIGVLLGIFFVSSFKARVAGLLIAGEVAIFFLICYLAFMAGYAWSYFDFPFVVIISSIAAKKILSLDIPANL